MLEFPIGGFVPVWRSISERVKCESDLFYAGLPIGARSHGQAAHLLSPSVTAAAATNAAESATRRGTAAEHVVADMAAAGASIDVVGSSAACLTSRVRLQATLRINTVSTFIPARGHGQRCRCQQSQLYFTGLAHKCALLTRAYKMELEVIVRKSRKSVWTVL